jgi:hypothetical protein
MAFNHAYLLAKYNASILEKLVEVTPENNYVSGLKDGKKTYDLEMSKFRLKEIERLRSKNSRDVDLER